MSKDHPRWLTTAILLLTLLVGFLLGFQQIAESDSFWHLKTGEWIAQHHEVPRVDPFVPAAESRPWLDWEWLFQLGAHLVYVAGGFTGLVTVKALVVALTALVIMVACRRAGAEPWLSAAVVLAALMAARPRMEMRPDVLMFLFAAIMVLVLELARTGERKWLWVIPIVQVAWVNIHPSFPLGICLVGAWFFGGGVGLLVGRLTGKADAQSGEAQRGLVLKLGLATAATALAMVVNPYGLALVKHAIEQLHGSGPIGVIGEWQPTREVLLTESDWALRIFWCLWWLTPFALVGRLAVERGRFPWTHVVVVIGLSILGLRAQRFTALYALVTAPILAGALGVVGNWFAVRFLRGVAGTLAWAGRGLVAVTACVMVWWIVSDRWAMAENRPARFGAGVDDLTVPVRAVDALQRLPSGAGLFNTYVSGGYLIWRLYPDWMVEQRWAFADSRANMFGRDYLDHYLRAMRDPRRWEEWMREKDVSVVFMQYGTADDRVLLEHLAKSQEWHLAYFDHAACVYVRQATWDAWKADGQRLPDSVSLGDEKAVLLYAHQVADQESGDDKYNRGRILTTIGNFLMASGRAKTAQPLFEEAVQFSPRISEAWMNQAVYQLENGHWNEAMQLTTQLLLRNPRYYMAWLMQAQIRMHMRDVDGALTSVRRALALAPRSAQALVVRAQVAVVQGEERRAIEFLRKAVAEGADDAGVYWFLGRLLAKQGRAQEAVEAYQNSIRL
jgi:tetratricopeptide (TPR) repeat protein